MTARTHEQLFQRWKDSQPIEPWRDHWIRQNSEMLKRYELLGFRIIPLAHKSKRPIDDWTHIEHTWLYLFAHLATKGNIGVVAGLSKPQLCVLDYDDEILPVELANKTLTSVSPNGFHIFTKGKFSPLQFDRLRKKYPRLDNLGKGVGRRQIVLPPSETCKSEHAGHLCEELRQAHQFRMHEWIDLSAPILTFSEYAKICLKT